MEHVLALVDAVLIVAVGVVLAYLGNDRFHGIERRIDRLEDRMETRFAQVDTRFDRLTGDTNARFDRLTGDTNAHFSRVEGSIDGLRADVTRLALTLVPPREAGQG